MPTKGDSLALRIEQATFHYVVLDGQHNMTWSDARRFASRHRRLGCKLASDQPGLRQAIRASRRVIVFLVPDKHLDAVLAELVRYDDSLPEPMPERLPGALDCQPVRSDPLLMTAAMST